MYTDSNTRAPAASEFRSDWRESPDYPQRYLPRRAAHKRVAIVSGDCTRVNALAAVRWLQRVALHLLPNYLVSGHRFELWAFRV